VPASKASFFYGFDSFTWCRLRIILEPSVCIPAEVSRIMSFSVVPKRFPGAISLALAVTLLPSPHLPAQVPAQGQTASGGQGVRLSPEGQGRLDQLQASLKSAIAAGDAKTAGKIFNQLGDFWVHVENPQNAQENFTHALAAAKMAQDAETGVTALNGLGNLALNSGQTQQAFQNFQQALQVASARGLNDGKAGALNGLALYYKSQKQPKQALEYANQALAVRQAMGDRDGQAIILGEIAQGYGAAGENQKALDYAQQAHDLFQAVGDHRNEALSLIGMGIVYTNLRDRKAMEYFTQALAITHQFKFPRIQANALNLIGTVEEEMGDNQKALDNFNQALPIYQRMNMAAETGMTMSNIAIALSNLGEKEKALKYYDQALPMVHAAGDRDGEARILANLGFIYQGLGDKPKAIEYYSQALPLIIASGDRAIGVKLLDNLGAAYVELGDPQKALEVLNQALGFEKGLPNHLAEALARISMGMAYHKMGDNQKALESMNLGLQLVQHSDSIANEASAHTAIAKVYFDMGDKARALANLNQALPLAKTVNDPLILAPILYGMMLAQKAQPTVAIFYGKQAVNLLQQVRGNMQGLDQALQSTFVSSKAPFYHDLADLLIAQGRLPEAQQVLDLLKQQEYSDYVRGAETDALSPLTLTPAEQKAEEDYEKSTGQLVAAGQRKAELKSMSTLTTEQDAELKKLTDQLNAADKALDGYYSRLYVLLGKGDTANLQLRDVKGNVSSLSNAIYESPHTVALYTMVTGDHYRVIVITPSATVARNFAISEADLNKKVSDFEQALRSPSSEPKRLAHELYTILVGPVQSDLDQAKAETLVWSLDGVLRYVPIAALYDGKQYMLEKYNTVTITPASISNLRDKPDVGNLSVSAMGIARKFEDGLPALPAVAVELNDVVRDAQVNGANGALPGTILLDGQFTEKAMESQLSGKHRVVHIASHFVFKAGDDSQSYLLLAGKDTPGEGFHLTVADFRDNRDLDLRQTDLLTLSACETGMSGSASNGREVDGLGTTAQLKGAKAVISSLWPVNDASTGELMGDFYKRWAAGAGKVTKVEALRQAQLDLFEGHLDRASAAARRGLSADDAMPPSKTGYSHPFYWAPFVLMGNWQ
jgi:CHAT domain-containing protein/Tfp pilus assembly protein PilF